MNANRLPSVLDLRMNKPKGDLRFASGIRLGFGLDPCEPQANPPSVRKPRRCKVNSKAIPDFMCRSLLITILYFFKYISGLHVEHFVNKRVKNMSLGSVKKSA